MKIVKLAMIAFGLLGLVLSLAYDLQSYGMHGLIVMGACAIPVLLGALGTFVFNGLPRWAAGLSALAFLVAAMKTSKGTDFQNIMMAAAAGLLLALALLIKPDRRAGGVVRRA